MQTSKIGTPSHQSENFLIFTQLLNGLRIRMINAITLQFSGITFHIDINKYMKFRMDPR